jgi:HPt (histidine-containing phosphotransfer) domain-containing protein
MTADAFPEDRDRCRKAGMDEFISKPYRPHELISKLASVLGVNLALPATGKGPPSSKGKQTASHLFPADNEHLSISKGLQMVDGNVGTYLHILRSFLEDSMELLPAIGQALEKGDLAAARRSLHSLKGISGTVGAMLLFRLCKRSEQDFNDLRSSMDGIVHLGEELAVVREMMQKALAAGMSTLIPWGGQQSDSRPLTKILTDIQGNLGTDILVPDSLIDELGWAFAKNGNVPEGVADLITALRAYDYPRCRQLMESTMLIDPRVDAGV